MWAICPGIALVENDLVDKPGNVYNMDETGLLNNKPGHVFGAKALKASLLLPREKRGKLIVACYNAEDICATILHFQGKK
jgi:hypothetical protein